MGRTTVGGIAAVGVVAVLALAAVAVPLREPVQRGLLTWQASRPLDETEAAALARCEDPGWVGLSRVLEQDLDVSCRELWLAQTLGGRVGDLEARWLAERSDRPLAPARQRFRAATALALAGRTVPSDWPFLATDPDVGPGVRDEIVAAALAGFLAEDLLDPLLREDLDRARFYEGDLDGRDAVVRVLRRYASRPERASQEERARWTSEVLAVLGFPGDRLETVLERRRTGLSWQASRPALMPLLVNRGSACADRASPGCLALAADLLVADRSAVAEGIDGGPGGEVAEVTLPPPALRAHLEVLTGDPGAVAAAGGAFAVTAGWIGSAEGDERAVRLLGTVAWPGSAWGVAAARSGLVGDPVDVLVMRNGSPWAVALAAITLGEASGVGVSVHAAGDGVRLVADGREARVAPCGGVVGLHSGRGPAWPVEAVAAQAALEAAGGALRGGRSGEAVRMAVFAERLDPIGAAGASAAVASVAGESSAEESLGRRAGGRVASAPAPTPIGAETERTARAASWTDLAAAWAVPADPTTCPTVLGP